MTIAIITHPDCQLHYMGSSHPEHPDRVKVIHEALERYAFSVPVEFHLCGPVDREHLIAAHEERYVNWIYSISPKKDMIEIDEDTFMNPHTLRAALLAAGAVTMGVDLVMNKEVQAVFCNVRPPGHHAEREKAMGFCFYNNVAVALEHYNLSRIAIIDFDVHHGNGTQSIFQYDERVMICSSFEHPLYPGYEQEMDNEHILNVPLPAGTQGEAYRAAVAAAWFDKLRKFKPELIFFSAGFDAHQQDLLANLSLVEADYVWLTRQIAQIAKECCQGRMISVLEGGYDLNVLAECVPAHVNAMVI
jgi:acetoin utilization deacetylase AcuC-like enzyme